MDKLKEVQMTNWVKYGEGGNAISYYNTKDNEIILKLAKNESKAIESMKDEINCIDTAMTLNINTPKIIEKVTCNGRIGIIYERVHNKKSLGRLCHDNPEKIKTYAEAFANETYKLHSLDCAGKNMKDVKKDYINALMTSAQDKIYTPKVINLIKNEASDSTTCLHGDLTVGNILLAGDNKWYWIDLGRIGYGDPLFDLSDAYYSFNVLSQFKFVRDIFHMTRENLADLWKYFIAEYASLTHQNIDELTTRIKRISVAYFFKIWATGKHIPIISQIVHRNSQKYYDKIIGG